MIATVIAVAVAVAIAILNVNCRSAGRYYFISPILQSMFKFKYNRKIDEANWERLVHNGKKFGHEFPSTYCLTKNNIDKAKKKVPEFQALWDKYDNAFLDKIPNLYDYNPSEDIICYVNSSPYSSFNPAKNYLSISWQCQSNRLVPSVLHEVNHLLFYKNYWNFCLAINCSLSEIDIIKEIITVINDQVFYPMQDNGWKKYSSYRRETLLIWKRTKNMKMVIQRLKMLLDKEKSNRLLAAVK